MLTAILVSLLFGVLWGAIWGAVDAIFIVKGVLASGNQMASLFRGLIAMFIGLGLTSLFLGANDLISMIVALLLSFPARDFVLKNWRW